MLLLASYLKLTAGEVIRRYYHGKIGNDIPHPIDQAIDFMASTKGVPRVFEKTPRNTIPSDIPEEKCRYIYNVWNIIASFTGQSR